MAVDFSWKHFGFGVVISKRLGLAIMLGPLLIQFFTPEGKDARPYDPSAG